MSRRPAVSSRVRRARIREMEVSYLQCHAWGHQWDPFLFPDMREPHFGYRESMLCVRCSTERHFIIDSRGQVASRDYRYPPGYSTGFVCARSEYRRQLRARAFTAPELRHRPSKQPRRLTSVS